VTPSDTCDTAFLAHFLKSGFFALSVEWAILTKFTEPNCSTETAVGASLILFVFLGDEILSINGQVLQGMTHGQAILVFKTIRHGSVSLHIARRQQLPMGPGKRKFKSQSCEELEVLEE